MTTGKTRNRYEKIWMPKPNKKTNTPNRKSWRAKLYQGFSLMEVLFTVALLAVSLTTLLQGISQGLQSLQRAERLAAAAHLAQKKMAELELKEFKIGAQNSGKFASAPGFRWEVDIHEPTMEQAKEFNISQVDLIIFWQEGKQKRQIKVTTYTTKIKKLKE